METTIPTKVQGGQISWDIGHCTNNTKSDTQFVSLNRAAMEKVNQNMN